MSRKTILIVDDDVALVEALTIRCQALGLEVKTAYEAREAMERVRQFSPDLICLDMHMPSGSGWRVCEMLAVHHQGRIPTILLTGDTNEETVRRCYNMAVFYVEKCTDLWPRLEPLVCELLHLARCAPAIRRSTLPAEQVNAAVPVVVPLNCERGARGQQPSDRLIDSIFEMLVTDERMLWNGTTTSDSNGEPPWILCVDDDGDYSMALKLRLESYGVAVVRAFDGMAGLRTAFTRPADLILLDYEMPNGRGDYILRRLKDNPVTKDIPVIMITGKRDRLLERQILAMGAERFMNKPPDFDELVLELGKYIPILSAPSMR